MLITIGPSDEQILTLFDRKQFSSLQLDGMGPLERVSANSLCFDDLHCERRISCWQVVEAQRLGREDRQAFDVSQWQSRVIVV
jgi:hypothetical protein